MVSIASLSRIRSRMISPYGFASFTILACPFFCGFLSVIIPHLTRFCKCSSSLFCEHDAVVRSSEYVVRSQLYRVGKEDDVDDNVIVFTILMSKSISHLILLLLRIFVVVELIFDLINDVCLRLF